MVVFEGIAPIDIAVACTDVVHHGRFADGRLLLLDHDVDAERTMAALGGDVPPCVELAELWQAALATVADGHMNSIHGLRQITEWPAEEDPWEPPNVPFSGPARPGVLRTLMHTRLPAALEDVLAQAAVLDCERRWADADFPVEGKRLGLRVLTDRVEAALRLSLQRAGDGRNPVRLTLACHVVTEESVSADVEANHGHIRLDLDLRLGWLVRVWRAGLATAGAVVVLDIVGAAGDRVTCLALEWQRRGHDLVPSLRRTALERRDGRWVPTDTQGGGGDQPWWSVRTGPHR